MKRIAMMAALIAACGQDPNGRGEDLYGETGRSSGILADQFEIGSDPMEYEVGLAWIVTTCSSDGYCRNKSDGYVRIDGLLCSESGDCELSADGEPRVIVTTW